MHRLFRLTAVLAAAFMLVAGLKVQPAAAQDGLTGDTSYESPMFGYEVEWSSDWDVIPDLTTSGESTDSLRIYSEEYGSWIDIWGFESNDRDPGAFLESYIALLEDSDGYANIEATEQESADPGAVAVILNYELGDDATLIEDYIEVRTVGNALVLTSLKAGPGFSLIVAMLAVSQVTLDGDPLFPSLGAAEADDNGSPSDDEEDDNGGQSGVDGGAYVGPAYGVTLEFDEDAWDVVEDLSADDNGGRDVLLIEHTDLPIRVYFETYDTIIRASECLGSASEEAYGDADAEIFEDGDGEAIEGSSRGVAYAAYLFENEDGDELVAYVECRALPEGAGVFVITMLTFPDEWDDAFAELTDVLDTVELEGGSSSSSSSDDEEDNGSSSDDEEDNGSSSDDEEDDRGSAAAGTYESPTYGFMIEYDEDVWTQIDDSSRRGTDIVEFENEDDVVLIVTATEAGSRDDAESCVEDYIDDFDGELVQVTNSEDDEPLAGETDFGYYSIMAYDDVDGETYALYLECGASPDDEYLVLFVADGPWDGLSDMAGAVIEVIDTVEF